jgi:hypothetical protein
MSMVSLHTTVLEVCDYVYGDAEIHEFLEDVDRFYESGAVYENPFLTATSRSVIADIHKLSRLLSKLDIPKPLAMLYTLFRFAPPDGKHSDAAEPLCEAVRVWTDIGNICESDSFDGHRRTIVEHTLNILFFPGIHSSLSALSLPLVTPHLHPAPPALKVPLTSLVIPTPLHFQLHVMTRLSFNEQGRITHHRDFWDMRDVVGLVPGLGLFTWIGCRVTAQGLSFATRLLGGVNNAAGFRSHPPSDSSSWESGSERGEVMENDWRRRGSISQTPAAAYGTHARNALGLEL